MTIEALAEYKLAFKLLTPAYKTGVPEGNDQSNGPWRNYKSGFEVIPEAP